MIKLKMENEQKKLIGNIILNIFYKPVGMIVSLIYTPIAISYLGDEKYGIWATVLSILAWILQFDVGIGNGLRDKLTIALTNKNRKEASELVSSAYISIFFVVFCIFIAFLGINFFVNWNDVFKVPRLNENLDVVMIISILFICLNFLLSLCNIVNYALQQASLVSLSSVVLQVLNLIGTILLSFITSNSLIGIAFIYGVSSFITNVIFSIIAFRKEKSLVPKLSLFRKEKVYDITSIGLHFFIIQIAGIIVFTTDNMIITRVLGVSEVTPYNIVYRVFSLTGTIFTAIMAPLWSYFTKAKSLGEIKKMKSILSKLNIILAIFGIGILVLTIIFKDLARIWLQRELNYGNLLIPFAALYAFVSIFCNKYAFLLNGLGRIKVQLYVAIIQGIVNIPLSIFFVCKLNMGSAGVLLGTIVSLMLSAIALPIDLHNFFKEYGDLRINLSKQNNKE